MQNEYAIRQERLKSIREQGINPYPASVVRTQLIKNVVADFSALETTGAAVAIVGRLRLMRGHGGSTFFHLEDGSGKIQCYIKKDVVGEDAYTFFSLFDVGDFVAVNGLAFHTKKGEPTIQVKTITLLTKSLRPLPDKFHGLQDMEARLRHRYLDLLMNPEARELFRRKALFWSTIRTFMLAQDFLEVETPVLETVPGGAEAEPFVTHHRALDRDFFLRISLELPLKRLMVGGYEKVFEIGRIFRNEGISTEHLQDYTQLEFYWAYTDYNSLMQFVQELYRSIVKSLFNSYMVTNQGRTVDWGKEWKRYDYYELFLEHAGLDLKTVTEAELKKKADTLHIKYEKFAHKGRLIDLIYKKTVRPKLIDPGFLIDPPVEVEPLAKRKASDPTRVERVQVIAWGTELGKGFSELNDPIDQRARFAEQMKLRAEGDAEAQPLDLDFVEALEYGMPPTAGFGLSERLFAVLSDLPIRETVLFPPMREKM